jgi:hypothetical protein
MATAATPVRERRPSLLGQGHQPTATWRYCGLEWEMYED